MSIRENLTKFEGLSIKHFIRSPFRADEMLIESLVAGILMACRSP